MVARKTLTRDQAETAKKRAVLFLHNVLGDDDRASDVESQSLDDWAEQTGRTITNPKRSLREMAQGSPTKADLEETIDQVTDLVTDALDPALTREEVIEKLQEIDGILSGDDDDSGDDTDDNDGEDDSD